MFSPPHPAPSPTPRPWLATSPASPSPTRCAPNPRVGSPAAAAIPKVVKASPPSCRSADRIGSSMRKVLLANRGEIARRIIRTAHRMGLETVAVYSEADANAPHVREATQAVLIGPAPAAESYLRVDNLLD